MLNQLRYSCKAAGFQVAAKTALPTKNWKSTMLISGSWPVRLRSRRPEKLALCPQGEIVDGQAGIVGALTGEKSQHIATIFAHQGASVILRVTLKEHEQARATGLDE